MMKWRILILGLVCAWECQAQACPPIANKATRIDSVNLFGNDIPSSLDSILKRKRIVFLGEENHCDGSSIWTKSKIIELLTKSYGFQVLVLELPFYELDKANDYLTRPGIDPRFALYECLKSGQVISRAFKDALIPMLLRNRQTLRLQGVELASNDSEYQKLLARDLTNQGVNKRLAKNYCSKIESLNKKLWSNGAVVQVETKETTELRALSDEIFALLKNRKHSESEADFLSQVIKSNLGLINWIQEGPGVSAYRDVQPADLNKFHRLRDRYLAENLEWLLSNRFPNKKVIVSVSTYHMSRKVFELPVMADNLSESLVSESLFIPFLSYQGSQHCKTDFDPRIVKYSRDDGSLEHLLHSCGFAQAFLPFFALTATEKRALDTYKLYAVGGILTKASWSTIYDGIFFINRMVPDELVSFSLKEDEALNKLRNQIRVSVNDKK